MINLRHILIQAIALELVTLIVSDAAELGGRVSFDDLGTTV
jgi:hypothetical protein